MYVGVTTVVARLEGAAGFPGADATVVAQVSGLADELFPALSKATIV